MKQNLFAAIHSPLLQQDRVWIDLFLTSQSSIVSWPFQINDLKGNTEDVAIKQTRRQSPNLFMTDGGQVHNFLSP